MINNQKHYQLMVLLVVLLTMSSLLTACQPTPQEEVVVDMRELEEKITQQMHTSLPNISPNDITDAKNNGRIVWSETNELNGIDVTFKIDAQKPDISVNVPVVVIEPESFNLEFAKNAAEFFLGKNKLFVGEFTKEDISMARVIFERALHNMKVDDESMDIKGYLEFMDERYENSREQNIPGEISFQHEDGCEYMHLKTYPNNEVMSDFWITNDDSLNFFRYHKDDYFFSQYFMQSEEMGSGVQAKGCEMSYNEAQQLADEVVNKVYSKSDAASGLALQSIRLFDIKNEIEIALNENDETDKQGYAFIYTRKYHKEIPTLIIDGITVGETDEQGFEPEYREAYCQEYAYVLVDDSGVVLSGYISPSKVIGVKNDNVAVISFEDAIDIFKKNIFYQNIWAFNSVTLCVNKIEFGFVRLPVKDNIKQYMMVPAYNFVGGSENNVEEIGLNLSETNKSILLINAVDGSIISNIRNQIEIK